MVPKRRGPKKPSKKTIAARRPWTEKVEEILKSMTREEENAARLFLQEIGANMSGVASILQQKQMEAWTQDYHGAPPPEPYQGYRLEGNQFFDEYTNKALVERMSKDKKLAKLAAKALQPGGAGDEGYSWHLYFMRLRDVYGLHETTSDYDKGYGHHFDWKAWRKAYKELSGIAEVAEQDQERLGEG